MTAMPFCFPIFKAFTTTGTLGPLAGGLLHTFEAGTSTPLAVYQDAALTVPHTNPVVLDSNGQATIYLGPNAYKMRLEDSTGSVQPGWPIDGIEDPLDNAKDYTDTLRADLAASSGSSMVGFLQSGTGAVARTVQGKNRDIVHAKDFGAVFDGVTDDTDAINAATAYANTLVLASLTAPWGDSGTGSGGCTVILPPGKGVITGKINLYNSVSIKGAGIHSTIISSSFDDVLLQNTLTNYNFYGMTLEDFTILGDRTKPNQIGLDLLRPYYCDISKIVVRDCGSHGAHIRQSIGTKVSDSWFMLNVGRGLWISEGIDSWANPVTNNLPSNAVYLENNYYGFNDGAGLYTSGQVNGSIVQGGISEYNYHASPDNVGYHVEWRASSIVPCEIDNLWVEGSCQSHIYVDITGICPITINKLHHFGNGPTGNVDRCLIVNSGRVSLNDCFGHGGSYKNIAGSIAPFRLIKGTGYIQLVNCSGSTLAQNLAGYDGMIEDENGLTTGLFNSKKIVNYNYHYGDQIFRGGDNTANAKFYGDSSAYPVLTLDTYNRGIWHGTGSVAPTVIWRAGSGSPEGVVTASVGSLFTRTNGGAGTTLYIKESGTGNTGWVAK